MHILAYVIMSIFDALGSAAGGDYDGINKLGGWFVGIGLFFVFGCIITGFSTDGSGTIFLVALVMAVLGFFMSAKR